MRISSDLGSDGSTVTVGTSSGDAFFDTNENGQYQANYLGYTPEIFEKALSQSEQEQLVATEKAENLLHQLNERMKELRCLYDISRLTEKDKSLAEILQMVVDRIPNGWQYPDITCSQLTMNGQRFKSKGFRQSSWGQSQDVMVAGEKKGCLDVYYIKEMPVNDEGPFLIQERDLLNAIAERISRIAERYQAMTTLEKSRQLYHQAEEIGRSGHWERDFFKNIISWSPGTYKIFGRSPDLFTPTFSNIGHLIHPDDYAQVEDMMQAEFSDNINVIVQVDYAASNSTPAAYRYHIYPGLQEQISYIGEIDSGDENELTSFANWGFNKYPSEKQALIIWSHGNGWYPFFCNDVEADNDINIPDGKFRRGIKNINEHLEILILDACNMQTVEVSAEVADYTEYIIASEGGINSAGFPYSEIFSMWESEDNVSLESLCLEIGYQYYMYYSMAEIYPISCSVLKTSEFPQLLDRLEEFTAVYSDIASSEIFVESRQQCLEFKGAWSTNPALDVDIKEFFTVVNDNTENDSLSLNCAEILTTLESCYIFQNTDDYPTGHTSDDVGAAIIWFPDEETQGFFDIRKAEYQQLRFAQTNWLDFLENTFSE